MIRAFMTLVEASPLKGCSGGINRMGGEAVVN